ncbi:MAG: hypothetical protein WCA04_13630 [Geobacteraceae bacterium]
MSTCTYDEVCGTLVDTSIHRHLDTVEMAAVEHSAQECYFIQAGMDKLLPTETWFDGHYQERVHFSHDLLQHSQWSRRMKGKAFAGSMPTDASERLLRRITSFSMHNYSV